jgi:hypothetical protein
MAAEVEIVLAPDGVDGDVTGYDRNGKRMDLPHRIVISPYFYGATACANLAYTTVKSGNREISRTVIQLSGATGKVKTLDRSSLREPKFAKTDVSASSEELAEVEVEEEVEETDAEQSDSADADGHEDVQQSPTLAVRPRKQVLGNRSRTQRAVSRRQDAGVDSE